MSLPVNPAKLMVGTRYVWSPGNSGEFVRYEVDRHVGIPIVIFRDYSPRVLDWTSDTEIVIGLPYLIDVDVREAE